jgi:hypothetical protein
MVMLLVIGCAKKYCYDRSNLKELEARFARPQKASVTMKDGSHLPGAGISISGDTLLYPGINNIALNQIDRITVMNREQGAYKLGLIYGLAFGSMAALTSYMSGDDLNEMTNLTAEEKARGAAICWGLAGGLLGLMFGGRSGWPEYHCYSDTLPTTGSDQK